MDVFLYDALRTPRGKGRPDGALATVPPHELVGQLVAALRARHGEAVRDAVDTFALGCVTQSGVQGGHLALTSRIHAGLPHAARAATVNNYCVSGMTAIALAARTIAAGESALALAGGVESMSQVPFEGDNAPFYRDHALAERFRYLPPPIVADWLATREGFGRADLDAVTLESHRRAGLAWAAGAYADSVVPVARPDGTRLDRDETVRPALALADLARFEPAFAGLGAAGADARVLAADSALARVEHVHTVAHCPPVADGAALALLGTGAVGRAFGLAPRARLAAVVEVGTDPLQPFEAGFVAFERVLDRIGLPAPALGAIEFMEAFAAVPVRFMRRWPELAQRTNPAGGHLALGHPMGASGAILVATLLANMEARDAEWGVAVVQAISGIASAVALQRGPGPADRRAGVTTPGRATA